MSVRSAISARSGYDDHVDMDACAMVAMVHPDGAVTEVLVLP